MGSTCALDPESEVADGVGLTLVPWVLGAGPGGGDEEGGAFAVSLPLALSRAPESAGVAWARRTGPEESRQYDAGSDANRTTPRGSAPPAEAVTGDVMSPHPATNTRMHAALHPITRGSWIRTSLERIPLARSCSLFRWDIKRTGVGFHEARPSVRLAGILDEASPLGGERLASGLKLIEPIPVQKLAVTES